MKKLMVSCVKGVVKETTNGKKSAITKTWSPEKGDLCTWMLNEMKTEDVELRWAWNKKMEAAGHIIAISQVTKNKDGSCLINYRDDMGYTDKDEDNKEVKGQGDGMKDDGYDWSGTLSEKDGKLQFRGNEWRSDPDLLGIMVSGVSESLPVIVDFFEVIPRSNNYEVIWKTSSKQNNSGFRIWRGIKNNVSNYKVITLMEFNHSKQVNPKLNESCLIKVQGQLKATNFNQDSKPISAVDNSAESICYSFTDTSNLSDGTYYYLLEDIGDNGDSTFHCDQIDAVTVGQGPAINLESAINYCKEVTGSNN